MSAFDPLRTFKPNLIPRVTAPASDPITRTMCTRDSTLRRDYVDDEGFTPAQQRHLSRADLDVDRVCRVYPPDGVFYEFRDAGVFRTSLSLAGEWSTVRLTSTPFIILGRYPPEGATFEWGLRILLDGVERKLTSRAAVCAAGLAAFFTDHDAKFDHAKMKHLAEALDWLI